MKLSKYFLGALLAALCFNSCTKDLNQLPPSSKVLSTFFSTQGQAEEYVNSVYASLQAQGMYGRYFPILAEIASDNTWDQVPANDNGDAGQLDLFTTIPGNGIISSNWQASYITIQRANLVLHRIDSVPYTADSTRKARKGAMQFIRALVYFNLVRTYGDVPLVTKETTDPNSYFGQGRTARDSVYMQIIKDLNEAIPALPYKADQTGGVIKTAAQALLGKVYLTEGRYQDAAVQLSAVVQSGVHKLLPAIASVFDINNENNAECLFSVQFASGLNGNTEGSVLQQQTSPSGFESGAKGHNLPTTYLYRLYTNGDLRKGVYLDTTKQGVPYCKKYVANTGNPSDGGSNFVALRYADVLLMLAEADNESGNTTDALTYLNMIRNRAGLISFTVTDQAQIRAEIDLERQLELVGEGHRWFDLLRKGNAVQVMNSYFTATGQNISIDSHDLLMPVPQDQIDTDPSITQNKGY